MKPWNKRRPTREVLEKLNEKPRKEVAKLFNVSYGTVCNWYHQYGLKRNRKAVAQDILNARGRIDDRIKREDMHRLYYEENKTLEEIAKIFGVSITPIRRLVEKYGIQRRDTRIKKGNIPWNKGEKGVYEKEVLVKLSEKRKGKHLSPETEIKKGQHISPSTEFKKGQKPWNKEEFNKLELERLYLQGGKTIKEIAEFFNCAESTIKRAIHEFKIPTRDGRIKKGQKPWNKGKQGIYTEETIQKIRETRMKQQIPTSKTKPERILEEIISKYNLPYKYTGDGGFWIGGINPDFVNCNSEKIAVEVFGDYWHNPEARPNITFRETEYGRKKILERYGWKLIILWESEIYNLSEEEIVNKLSRAQYIVFGGRS